MFSRPYNPYDSSDPRNAEAAPGGAIHEALRTQSEQKVQAEKSLINQNALKTLSSVNYNTMYKSDIRRIEAERIMSISSYSEAWDPSNASDPRNQELYINKFRSRFSFNEPFNPLKEVGFSRKESEISSAIEKRYYELMNSVKKEEYYRLSNLKYQEAELEIKSNQNYQGFEFAKTQDLGQLDAWLAANPHESEFRKSVEYVRSIKQVECGTAHAMGLTVDQIELWLAANPGDSFFRKAVEKVLESKKVVP